MDNFRIFLVAILLAACGSSASAPTIEYPYTVEGDCQALCDTVVSLCEELNAHSGVGADGKPGSVDCWAVGLGDNARTCAEVVGLRDRKTMERDCRAALPSIRPHFFSGGGGWYELPVACRGQLIFASYPSPMP